MPQGRGSTAARASFANGRNLPDVGLHQCPSERRGEGVPVGSLRVPSHVPSQPQTAAKVRGFSPIASGFTAETDWLLEQSGFELWVPPACDTPGSHKIRCRLRAWREMDSNFSYRDTRAPNAEVPRASR
jgi:hypothetical protein